MAARRKKEQDIEVIYLNSGVRNWGKVGTYYASRPETHITVLTQGTTGLQTETHCYILNAPCAVILPPNLRHQFTGPDTQIEMMVATVLNVREPYYSRLMPRPELQIFPVRPEIVETLQTLHHYCMRARMHGDEFSQASGSALILSWFSLLFIERSQSAEEVPLTISNMPQAIAARLTENLHIGALARDMGISESTFRRQYRAEFGDTPTSALREARLLHAANLLSKTDLKVQSVAYACGFSTVQAFSKFFRKHMKISPAKWRETDIGLRWHLRYTDNKETESDNNN